MTEFDDSRMDEPDAYKVSEESHISTQTDLIAVVSSKEKRKLAAREERSNSVWFGLGMFGMIGWSVAVPTLICVALGIWIDTRWQSRFSWTLMLLLLGMTLGCINAWLWVTRERSQINRPTVQQDQIEK